MEVWKWKIEYATKAVAVVASKMSAARPMKYSEVLELDRQVRDCACTSIPEPSTTTLDASYSTNSLQSLIKVVHVHAGLYGCMPNLLLPYHGLARVTTLTNALRQCSSSFIATSSL